jgi:hypothetical protein
MKIVKSLLLGTAAGIATVTAGQAADMPVKARPVEYVKVCSLYGDGFWYIPGTDTCIKLGGFVRAQFSWNAGNNVQPLGSGSFSDVPAGFNTRTDTNSLDQNYIGVISVDARTPTDYGTLRSYMDLGTQATSSARWGGNMSGLSVDGSIPTPVNSANTVAGNIGNSGNNYFNEATAVSRAFIQFAGFTAGRMRSFFDINSMGPYDLSNNRIQGDTAGGGIVGIAYTAQLGNGISASISLEDGGNLIFGRGYYVANMNLSGNWWVLGAGAFGDNSVPFSLDPVVNLRMDQAWGYAQISGALHGDSGGYYGTSELGFCGAGVGGTTATGTCAGHPADAWGWATSFGFTLNNFLGFKGDTFGAQIAYGRGAEGYVSHSQAGSAIVGSGNKVAYTVNEDAMYTVGSSIQLTSTWSFTSFYEHYWNQKWRTSVFGGITGVNYTATEKSMICPVGFGGTNASGSGAGPAGVGASNMFLLPGATCNPNYNTWQIGTRTMWNPHPMLDIGVEVLYTQLNQSNTGSFGFGSNSAVCTAAGCAVNGQFGSGALASGVYQFANQGVWSGMFRIQRNFLY